MRVWARNGSDLFVYARDLPGTLVADSIDETMSRLALLAATALLAGCAQSDAVTGPLPGGGGDVTSASGAATEGSGGGDAGGETGDGHDDDGPSAGGRDAGGPGAGGHTASSSAGGEDGGAGGMGGATHSSTGSGANACGDGVVSAGEECDDANAVADDGCSACVIDCEPEGAKAPGTGNCLRVFEDATTWPFAEANCAAWGGSPGLGHLASIADDDEQNLVFALIAQQAWIGVQDPITEGVYQWSDGSFWDYEHWAPGEPDDTHEEDCAFMRTTDDGGWNDHACGAIIPSYVCERRGAGTF